jgi:hypothetical protein
MPTVLDFLREHLLGDEIADRLEQTLAATTVAQTAIRGIEPPVPRASNVVSGDSSREPTGFLGVILGMGLKRGKVIEYLDELPPSPGYGPLLVDAGWNRIAARGVATLAVQHGRRIEKEGQWQRRVFDAIHFLGERPRQRRAILSRARLLIEASEATTIVETIFYQAGLNEAKFLILLKQVIERRQTDHSRIMEIAAAVSAAVPTPRGAKVSACSAAHEFLFRQDLRLPIKRRAYLGRDRLEEYVDPRTEATRREFGRVHFDSRPARRRIKNRQKTLPISN